MADFSDSDTDNEKAVEELLSQAMDQSVLEQVAAINCSGFTDSLLPTQLETRFRRLKSLPTAPTTLKPDNITRNSRSFCSSDFPNSPKIKKIDDDDDGGNEKIDGNTVEEKDLEHGVFQEQTKCVKNDVFLKTPNGKRGKIDDDNEKIEKSPVEKGSEVNLEDEFVQEQAKSIENDVFLKTSNGKKGKSLSSSSDSWKGCLSPPRKTGCFWCSPKKGSSNKKGKENKGVKWGKDDEFLSDLSKFSSKNQEKLMKKVMMEQEKINREAEKIVKWAKQASARMDVSSIEDELSGDDEIFK
ncbi:uncharacterized protein LOC132635503 [Lycium barbarum]|uniref:uncharacterized protein LOC132635503 n=1 Tax=Lycium barbarum TaxID=112863 RepID=UPI00293E1A15|nr:uncharacterized protein LOC132635503 [Lycium barbarum]